jgi:tetratricopeptide (TPR) repeat protein
VATEPGVNAGVAIYHALAAFQSGQVQAGIDELSAALRGFTDAGNVRQAALACARLGWAFETYVGNRTAARVWFRRAARLLRDEPDCLEQGWVAIAGVGCDVDDPSELRSKAEFALDRARRFGDVNLEAKALADGGLALVQAGEVTEGMFMLDEAVALWCGPADDRDAAAMGVCSFFTACYYSAEFDRASYWVDDLRRVGLIGSAPGAWVLLNGHCAAVQATALIELGRWSEAESLLARSIAEFEACMPIPSWHPAIALADLRIRQGLLADAEALLVGKDAHMQALLPVARLHLARGEVDLALATASRGLRMVGSDRLRGVELLALVAEAELAAVRVEAARAACDELMDRARGLDVARLRAQASRAQALLLAASGDLAEAISTMEQALDAVPSGLPVLRVELLLGLVRLHEKAGNRAAATVEAARATSVLAGLDVALPARDTALLQRFARTAPPTGSTAFLTRDGAVWSVSCDRVRVRLPATKGLRYLAELIRAPGVERHVLDLVDEVEGVAVDGPDRHHLGDAGELLDSAARRAYRHRVEELRTAVEEALADGADDRAAALQRECDELVGQLASAFGLSGRSRTASSAAERARLNVTRSVRTAIARIGAELPAAGQLLDRRIRTGLYCAFEPAAEDPVRWIVQS